MVVCGHVLVKNGNCYNFQTKPNEWHTLWDGWGLNMLEPVIRKSKEYPEKSYVILKTDILLKEDVTPEMESDDENVVFLMSCVGNVWPKRVKLFYSPLEMNFVPSTLAPHRGEKIPKLIWRGAANHSLEWLGSGGPRGILIKLLKDDSRCDLAYTRIGGVPTPECVPSMPQNEQQKYLGIFCIDGGGFANSLGWVLGSGSVPIVYSQYKMAFQMELEPWVHYVPIAENFSDLYRNIDWIFKNPEKCEEIIDNAIDFFKKRLNPEYVRLKTYEQL